MLDDAVMDDDRGSFGGGSLTILEVRIVLIAETTPMLVTPNFNGTTVSSEPLLEVEVTTGVPVGVRRRMGPRFAFVKTRNCETGDEVGSQEIMMGTDPSRSLALGEAIKEKSSVFVV